MVQIPTASSTTNKTKSLSLPQEPIELSSDEKAELERQNFQAQHPRFHDEIKCGAKLLLRFYTKPKKRNARYHRQECTVHGVIVDMSGWELGFSQGTDSRALSNVQWIQKKHRFNQ
jgi:hypothetical protein